MHLIIFDIDGTLVDTDGFDSKLYRQAIKDVLDIEVGPKQDFDHVTDTGILVDAVLKTLNREVTEKEFATVRDHFSDLVMEYLDANPDCCIPKKGVHDFMKTLDDRSDYGTAFATGAWGPTACFKLAAAGFSLDRLVMATSDDHFDRMEIMLTALSRAQDRLSEKDRFESITYVGDGPWDKLATEGLGWRFVGIGDAVKDASLHVTDYSDCEAVILPNS